MLLTFRRRTLKSLRYRLFSSKSYDVCVVGGGPGGYVAAIKAAQLGLQTVCIEKRSTLGGTCLNVGCIPSKALLHSSYLYEEMIHSSKHGIESTVRLNLDKMHQSKDKTVKGLTSGIRGLFQKNNVDFINGKGIFKGTNEVEVNDTIVHAKNIIIATGSQPITLPSLPIDSKHIVDSTGALVLSKVPKKMAVIGAGVIGLELGSIWRRLGAEVNVIEFQDRIVGSADKQIVQQFQKILQNQGITFNLETKVINSKIVDNRVNLTLEHKNKTTEESYDTVLVATGRKPVSRNMGLEELGVVIDDKDKVQTNSHFQTNIPSIYAIGDVINGPMLAHKAEEEGIACVEYIAKGYNHINYQTIPDVIYTHPELASVGKNEEELKENNISYNVGTFPLMANSRARAMQDSDGMVKVLSDSKTDKILGVHILAANASEMIGEATLAMEYGASSEDIARTCHAHPTISEALKEASMACYDKPIHF